MMAATSSYLAARLLTVPSRTTRFEFRSSETVPSAATTTAVTWPENARGRLRATARPDSAAGAMVPPIGAGGTGPEAPCTTRAGRAGRAVVTARVRPLPSRVDQVAAGPAATTTGFRSVTSTVTASGQCLVTRA